jgi:hypothetical protein
MEQFDTNKKAVIRAWLQKNVTPDQQMSMIEDPPPASRSELLGVWLEDNVFAPPSPKKVTLSHIEFDWESLDGSFRLTLDNLVIKDTFALTIDIAGQIKFCPPMFHSPLGAPASYAAVTLTQATCSTVQKALELLFPKLRGYGLHKETGIEIWAGSPTADRVIDDVKFQSCVKALAAPEFQVSETVVI